MKNTQILILFLIGTILIITGVAMKSQDIQMSSLPLIVGVTFESVSILALIFKMLKKNNNKSDGFLDS